MPQHRKKPIVIEAVQWDGTVKDAARVVGWVLAAVPAHIAIGTVAEGSL